MALSQTIKIPKGINLSFLYTDFEYCIKDTEEAVENAYIKIDNLNGDKEKVFLNIGIYDKKDGILIMKDNYEFIPDVSSSAKNFIQQGYEQLKANKYIGAIDLLDEGQIS